MEFGRVLFRSVARLQSFLLKQVAEHFMGLGFRQWMHAALVFLNEHAEHFEQSPFFFADLFFGLLHQVSGGLQEPLVFGLGVNNDRQRFSEELLIFAFVEWDGAHGFHSLTSSPASPQSSWLNTIVVWRRSI